MIHRGIYSGLLLLSFSASSFAAGIIDTPLLSTINLSQAVNRELAQCVQQAYHNDATEPYDCRDDANGSNPIPMRLYDRGGSEVTGFYSLKGVRCSIDSLTGQATENCPLRARATFSAVCPTAVGMTQTNALGQAYCQKAANIKINWSLEQMRKKSGEPSFVPAQSSTSYSVDALYLKATETYSCSSVEKMSGVNPDGTPICISDPSGQGITNTKCSIETGQVIRNNCGQTVHCNPNIDKGPCPTS